MTRILNEIWAQMKPCTEAVDLNSIVHSNESQVAAVRGVCLETPLVYPSAADKHTNYPIQAFCRGLSSTQSCRGRPLSTPTPQTGHRWNAAPGILPQLTGCRAAAGLKYDRAPV